MGLWVGKIASKEKGAMAMAMASDLGEEASRKAGARPELKGFPALRNGTEAVRILSPLLSVGARSEGGESPAVFGRPERKKRV